MKSYQPRPQKRESEASEHDIQSAILEWLEIMHIFHWRNNTGAMKGSHKGKRWYVKFGTPGSPDIFAVDRGNLIGIEVKRPYEKLSDKQVEFGEGLRLAGARYIVAYRLNDVIMAIAAARAMNRATKRGCPVVEHASA